MKKISLSELLDFLSPLEPSDFQGDSVDRFFSLHRLDTDSLVSYAYFCEETYARNLVHKTDRFELVLIAWLPRQFTAIHDHGGQRCWSVVQEGTLTFRDYAPIPEKPPYTPTPAGPPVTRGPEETVYLDDALGLHSIANASTKPALSLHLYAGPVPRCRSWDEKRKAFVWRDTRYFTEGGNPPGGIRLAELEGPPATDLH